MPQRDIRETFKSNQFRHEEGVSDLMAVEFRDGDPTDLTSNPLRVWANKADGEIKYTVDGENVHGVATAAQVADISINVKTLGAKGTGVDDTIPIQNALNQVAARGGGEVYVPDGIYWITSTLLIYSNTKLKLSKNAIIKRAADINAMLLNGTWNVGGYGTDTNITVDGGTWDGNKDNFLSAVTIIVFGHASNITVRDCTIKNAIGWHFIEYNAVKNGRVLNCNIVDFDSVTTGKEAVQLDLMVNSDAFPWFGPYDNTPCLNILIDGNTFDNGSRGIGSHSGAVGIHHSNIRIIGNHFDNMREEAIYGYDYEDVVIAGNTFANCFKGVVLIAAWNSSEGYIVANNSFDNMLPADANSRAIQVVGVSEGVSLSNGIISGNKVRSVGRHGIGIDFCSNWTIENNNVTKCGQAGIWYFGSTKGIIKNNQSNNNFLAFPTNDDIQIGGSALTTQDVIISGNVAGKIEILDKSDRVIVSNNIISISLSETGAFTNIQKVSNFIANVWTA